MTAVRRHTSTELRFLLTERAALAGSLAPLPKERALLESDLARLDAQAARARERLAAMCSGQLKQQTELEAIDFVLKQFYPAVDPSGLGAVSAWAGKYGRRGELKTFIHATIEAAYPAGVPTRHLLEAIVMRFTLSASKEELGRLAHVVVKQLSLSKAAGLVQSEPGDKRSSSVWFWNAGPSAARLRGYAVAGEASYDPHPDPVRAEVGG